MASPPVRACLLTIAAGMVLLGALILWWLLSLPPKAVVAWELKPPANEKWIIGVAIPQLGHCICGDGKQKRCIWVDASGREEYSLRCNSGDFWFPQWLGQVPFYMRVHEDSDKPAGYDFQRADDNSTWTIRVADCPLSPGASRLEYPSIETDSDGLLYLLYSTRDVGVISPDGHEFRRVKLEQPMQSLYRARPDGTMLFGISEGEEIGLFSSDGRLLWRADLGSDFGYVLSDEDQDGGLTLDTTLGLKKLAKDGLVAWTLNLPAQLDLPKPEDYQYGPYFDTCANGSYIGVYQDWIVGITADGKLAWKTDMYREKGFHVQRGRTTAAGDGVLVLLYRPYLKAEFDKVVRLIDQVEPMQISTHLAQVTPKGEIKGLWRIEPGVYGLRGIGPDGEVYASRTLEPSLAFEHTTCCRLDLPRKRAK